MADEETEAYVAKIIQVDGTWIPKIATYSVDMEDIDAEGTSRSESGKMHREVLRKKVKKLSVTCTHDNATILAVADMLKGDTVDMTVLCPGDVNATDFYATGTFYVTKISTGLMHLSGNRAVWSVSFNAIEV